MLFNSAEYLFFFAAAFFVAWAVVGLPRVRVWILLLASYYFYASNNHWLVALIVVSTRLCYLPDSLAYR